MADILHVQSGQALKKRGRISTTLILFGVLAAMVVVFSALSRDFYSFQNISTMLTNISFSGIVAGTLTLVMITGGLDISIGGNIALTSCLVAYLFKGGKPPQCEPIITCADPNRDGQVRVSDIIYLINYVLKSGPAPCS